MKNHIYTDGYKMTIPALAGQEEETSGFFHKLFCFIKKQPMLSIAVLCMLVTCIFVPVDKTYVNYFNWPTLATLYCTLAVVAALSHIHVFEIVSRGIVLRLHNLRNVTIAIVFITFIGSMFLANDMALLTFLPLGYYVLSSTGNKKAMAFMFIMQNIAANLGGMVTPFGNPQNLYLYAFYNIDTVEFTKIMLPSFLTSITIIFVMCLFVKPVPLTLKKDEQYTLDRKLPTVTYYPFPPNIIFCNLFAGRIIYGLLCQCKQGCQYIRGRFESRRPEGNSLSARLARQSQTF
ncbi:SLC13 family permease [Thermoclostridium stercorarium]|uniref:SLC13 family permease n=1 Tax=Thermoclostridium stercorarium TaxID=1510 RepID=UPI000AA10C9F|nr:SLC13 family permease [Thermoclostridium stercorarium]